MKLSQSVTYAVHATLRLAEHYGRNGSTSCGRLASVGKMPERFLLQILRDLAKQGILRSVRGGSGGFSLRRSPEDVSLLELIEAVEGPVSAGLPTNIGFPLQAADRLETALDRITEQTRQQLQAIKLSDLMLSSAITTLPPLRARPMPEHVLVEAGA